MKLFEKRRTKGAISIFLVIILIPVLLFSAVLIDGSRMVSARAMTQEAADLAAASALSDYNQKLKDDYGLFAMKDAEKLEEIYKKSLEATLLAQGISIEEEEYSSRIWGILKEAVAGAQETTSYQGKEFLNLYDFSVDQCTLEPLYPLAERNVLESQMVEYAKYRGLYVMGDRLDLFSKLSELKKEAEKNKVTAEVMEDKIDTDEKNAEADRKLSELLDEVKALNEASLETRIKREAYLTSLRGWMEEVRIENTDTDEDLSSIMEAAADAYSENKKNLKEAAKKACKQADRVLYCAEKAKSEVEKAIHELEEFKTKNNGKAADNESVSTLLTDADNNITNYKDNYLPAIEHLLDSTSEDGRILKDMQGKKDRISSSLNDVMEEIEEAVTAYIEVIEEMREEMEDDEDEDDEEILDYYYEYLGNHGSSMNADAVLKGSSYSYEPAVSELTDFDKKAGSDTDKTPWDTEVLNPAKQFEGKTTDKIDTDFAKKQSEKSEDAEMVREEAKKGKVESTVYQQRPSKTYESEAGKQNNTKLYQESGEESSKKKMSLESSKSILKGQSILLDLGETVRDDVLCLSYLFGTFKTRLTGVKKFSGDEMSESDKNSPYMPKWRSAHADGELDMRFSPKKDRKTVLRSEIEYLVYGNQSDTLNETAVYGTILSERLLNNLLVMYAEKNTINPACHTAAGVASLLTHGVVPETVFFWIFLTAWATAESIIEMNYLIEGGYKIPLIKTTNNILLKDIPSAPKEGLITNYDAEKHPTVLVSYEDYLLIMLLIKGEEKRLARTADLIEFNMKNDGEEDFTMAKAYTWLHADTKLSIRYLFGGVMPFQSYYEAGGVSGRMNFTNTIYQGY